MEALQNFKVTPWWLLIVFIFNCMSYYSLRNMVHSIVRCDHDDLSFGIGDDVYAEYTWWQRRRMWCMESFVSEHKKDFRFWCTVKDLFVIIEFAFCIITVLAIIFLPENVENWFLFINTLQSAAIVWITTTSTVFNDRHRHTKYERLVLKRRQDRQEFVVKEDGNEQDNSNNRRSKKRRKHHNAPFDLKVKEYDESGNLKDMSEKEDI